MSPDPNIPQSTEEVIRASTFHLVAEPYVYVKARSVPATSGHLLVASDDREITVVTHESRLSEIDVLDINPDRWTLFSIDCANPFYCVGFFAKLTAYLSEAGIDILVASTFTRDLVLVKTSETENARQALTRAGFRDGGAGGA